MPDFSPEQIRSVYINRCKNPAFSINLRLPTDARIKKECINLYKNKDSLGDKQILRDFLQISDDVDIGSALNREDVGKFKPVVKFLKNKTQDPRYETIELVAWLINFDNNDLVQQPPEQEGSGDDPNEEGDSTKDDVPTPPEYEKSQFKIHIVVTICIILIVVGGGGFLFWQDKTDRATITKEERCMYWTGDRYEAIACKLETNIAKISLDTMVLNRLKKITLPDTLTKNSLGKVWYATINNKKEFFTDSGSHPVDTVKRLKPLTPYILSNYVSYYRYILTISVWSFGWVILLSISIILLFKYKKKIYAWTA